MIRIEREHIEILKSPIPKYYGWGKSAYDRCVTYYYLIPFNFVVRLWERIKYRYYELMQNDKIRIREQRIYSRGYSDAQKSLKSLSDIVERKLSERVEELIKTGWVVNAKR